MSLAKPFSRKFGSNVGKIRFREAPKGMVPKDLKIIRTKPFTPEQHNSNCGPCHAKMVLLTTTFSSGDRFLDHYDLAALEDPDFYPDGRDLGENCIFNETASFLGPGYG